MLISKKDALQLVKNFRAEKTHERGWGRVDRNFSGLKMMERTITQENTKFYLDDNILRVEWSETSKENLELNLKG